MNFITVLIKGNAMGTLVREFTFNLNNVVSFRDESDSTRISFVNQEYVLTTSKVGKQLKEHMARIGIKVTKIGE